ncbi:MAG: PDZ domain-containing protein, partial [bacterium]
DVITGMNGKAIRELRDLSEALKSLSTGDKVRVNLLRNGTPITVEAVLKER